MMLGASHAAQVGINFQDNWGGTPYAPLTDATAFDIPLANWYNVPSVTDSGQTAVSTATTFPLPGGGTLDIAWSCKNTYSIYAAIPTAGNDQVIYGYLDDSDYGYSVTLTGLRAFASDYTITTIASTDQGTATGFMDAVITTKTLTNDLQYLANSPVVYGAGLWGLSTASETISAVTGNDRVKIAGATRTGDNRSTLAGILLTYTPSTTNPPLIEQSPSAPSGSLYQGQSFTLSATASGAPTLGFQWRKDNVEIPGATSATYTKTGAMPSDSGSYTVVVTNAYGSATSEAASVTIIAAVQPVIVRSPISQTLYATYPATFKVDATGGELTYQWKKNGTDIDGATTSALTLDSITADDAATYSVAISNPVGTTSASATLVVRTAAPGTYEDAVVQTRPAIWYRYSDSTAPVQDVAANSGSLATAGNGLYIGSNSRPVAGALAGSTDTAATFNGGRVSVPYSASLNSASFTIEAWLKPAVELTGTALASPLSSVHIADPRAGWLIYQSPDGWNLRTFNQNGTTAAVSITGGPTPVAGQWYHVVATWNGTEGRVYVNGVLAATSTPTSFVENYDGAFTVGARSDGAFAWSGAADEVALYATALSEATIFAHYQNGTNAARTTPYQNLIAADGAVEYLRLNEPAYGGQPANAGTLGAEWNGAFVDAGGVLGTPQITVGQPGPRPPAQPGLEANNLAVSMVNGYVSAPALGISTANITYTCWIKREEPSSSSDLAWPAWLGNGGMHMNNDGELRYHWDGSQWSWASGLKVPAGTWTFCAMVMEPDKATFYMSEGTTLRSAVHTAVHSVHDMNTPIGFGGNQPGRADRTYIGSLDESTVFTRALSQSEINTLFMKGTGAILNLENQTGGIIEDTKPTGTPHHGYNLGSEWTASSADSTAPTPITRTGIQQFLTADGDQIIIPANADFNSTVGTISFWIRSNTESVPGPGNEGAMIFDRRTSAGTVIVLNDGGAIFVQCAGGANSFSTGYIPDLNWHHVVVTYDQSASGAISIYIDGTFWATSLNTSAWSWPADQQIELGKSHDGYWKRLDAGLDEFRLYNRILTDAEIGQLYTNDAIVDEAALKLRYSFSNSGIGYNLSWPFGTLESSPTLGPSATWTPVPGATSPYPYLPTDPSLFFRVKP